MRPDETSSSGDTETTKPETVETEDRTRQVPTVCGGGNPWAELFAEFKCGCIGFIVKEDKTYDLALVVSACDGAIESCFFFRRFPAKSHKKVSPEKAEEIHRNLEEVFVQAANYRSIKQALGV